MQGSELLFTNFASALRKPFEKNRSDFIPGVAAVPPHADPDGEVRWHDRQTPLLRV